MLKTAWQARNDERNQALGPIRDRAIAAAKAADFVLMPIQPQLFDIETLRSLNDVLNLAGHPAAAVLVNRAPVQGNRHAETQEAAAAQGFTVCPVVIFSRAARIGRRA